MDKRQVCRVGSRLVVEYGHILMAVGRNKSCSARARGREIAG